MKYFTLNGEEFNLDLLSVNHKMIYEEMKELFEEKINWTDFSNAWMKRIKENHISPNEAIYKICQDLDSRLGLQQGYTRLSNATDEFETICEREKISGKIKKKFLFEGGELSLKAFAEVLNKEMMDRFGYRIKFIKADYAKTGEE